MRKVFGGIKIARINYFASMGNEKHRTECACVMCVMTVQTNIRTRGFVQLLTIAKLQIENLSSLFLYKVAYIILSYTRYTMHDASVLHGDTRLCSRSLAVATYCRT